MNGFFTPANAKYKAQWQGFFYMKIITINNKFRYIMYKPKYNIMKDVFFKDEGDFMTVGFVSDKAKKVIGERIHFTGKGVHKIHVDPSGKKDLITWCISHDLTIEDH